MAGRAKSLKFKGEWFERVDENGTVVVSGYRESLPEIPTRDLDEDAIRELSDEQYRDAVQSGLYAEPGGKHQAPQLTNAQKAALKKGYTVGADDPPRVVDAPDAPNDVPSTTPVGSDAKNPAANAAGRRPSGAARRKAAAEKRMSAEEASAQQAENEAPNGGNADGAGAES